MGKSNRPLNILVIGMPFFPALVELIEKGHRVDQPDPDALALSEYDLILGPQCARFVPGMEHHLESFIKGARAVKFGKKADA